MLKFLTLNNINIVDQPSRQYWIYTYLLFGLYSMTIAPFITQFISFGEKSLLVAIPGIVMYFAEFFAFKYKLKTICLRDEIQRIQHQEKTGEYLPMPHINPWLWFAVGMRMVFRLCFVMVSASALGLEVTENSKSIASVIIVLTTILVEILSLWYLFSKSVLLQNYPSNLKEEQEERIADEKRRNENITRETTLEDVRAEMYSDIILQVYSFMIFTAFWEYINEFGIHMIHKSFRADGSAIKVGIDVFTMLGAMVGVGLLPLRLAYWIEQSVQAVTQKQKWKVIGYFIIAIILTVSPTIQEYIMVYFRNN